MPGIALSKSVPQVACLTVQMSDCQTLKIAMNAIVPVASEKVMLKKASKWRNAGSVGKVFDLGSKRSVFRL